MSDTMNAEKMIDYVLGQSEGLDGQLDEEQAARVERLRQSVQRLLDDGTTFEHPPGLAVRTITFVARNRRRSLTLADQIILRVPFRWADFAVAASIFIAGILTLLPAIQRSRDRMNQAGCVFNLEQIGRSLAQYASLHSFWPYPAPHQSDAPAGCFAAMLHDAGLLQDPSLLDCPSNGKCSYIGKELVSFDQVEHIRHTDPARYQKMLCWDYAYNVGYRRPSGNQGPLEIVHSARIPILADQPDHENYVTIREGNSPNHGGRGQNVLFGDGSVRWLHSRLVGPNDPDLYLNNDSLPRPGVHLQDSVLVPSKTPFRGW
jgi:prepilin-type processing-associated H-X9-DG protein